MNMLNRKTNSIMILINYSLIDLPSPSNLSYMWNMGSLMGMCLLMQIITGLFLSMHYSNHTYLTFESISYIMRDVMNGWMLRSIHSNGASLFFILIYLHIGRGIYYSSFHLIMPWISGIIIIFLLMMTAFLGYVLPWGQMSFWGATVITNLISALPYLGNSMTFWLWGSFSVSKTTLMRFFSLHFILPFILMMMIMMHIMFLHETGSKNPMGNKLNLDKIPFYPYYMWKDLLGFNIMFMLFMFYFMIFPYFFSDSENFIPANSLSTPSHIQPEWYFLFAYAILRSIPNKLGGVLALLMSIMIIIMLPYSMKNKFYSLSMYPMMKLYFWMHINNFLILTYLGSCPISSPYVFLSQMMTILYFMFYIILSMIIYKN